MVGGSGMSIAERETAWQAEVSEAEVVRTAQQLIRTPSVSGSEGPVMEVARQWLSDRGLAVTLVARDAARPNLVCGFGNPEGPLLSFNGHLDTVPVGAGEGWTTDPFGGAIDDGRLYGRGALDMKGACAAMMHATSILYRHREGLPGRIQLQLVA